MKHFFNKYIILILGFYVFWLGALPFVFTKTLPLLCKNVSKNSDYQIEVVKPRLVLSILPTAKISAEKIFIQNKKNKDFSLVLNLSTKLRLLPLISGKLHINKISAEKLDLEGILNSNIVLDKNFFTNLYDANIEIDEVKLDNLKIIWKNEKLKAPISYNSTNLYYKKNNRYLKLNIDSEINVRNSVSKTLAKLYLPQNSNPKKSIVDIKVSNFDLAPLGDYLRNYLPNDLKELRGVINVNVDNNKLNSEIKNFAVVMKDSAKSMFFPETVNITSLFNVTGKFINFENIDIKSKNINASLNGTISNILDKSLTEIEFNVLLNKSKVEDIIAMLPPIVIEEFNVHKLKKYKFYGDAIGNLSIKGDLIEPEINGDIYIDNGILISPIKNAKGAIIKLDFIGKYVNFDVTVPAGAQEKVWVKGGVELYNVKYADMRIWSTQNVNLQTAQEKVVPLHEILNFIIGPVPIMDIKGLGNIDIYVKGNRKNPHVWGVLNLKNTKTFFLEMPNMVLTDADAILRFNDQSAYFNNTKGNVNQKPININGNCNLEGKFDFDVKSQNQEIDYLLNAIETSVMLDEIKSMLPKLDVARGLVNLNIKVYGVLKNINDLKFNQNFFTKGNIDLLGNTFALNGIEIKNTKGSLNFEGLNVIADIKSFIGNSAFTAKAGMKNNIADLDLNIPKLNLKDLAIFPIDIQNDMSNILVNVTAKYRGKIDKIEYDKINFVSNIIGSTPQNKLKISTGVVALNNNKLKISNLKGSIPETGSVFDININAENFLLKPHYNGTILLKAFDLSTINEFSKYTIIPKEYREYLKTVEFEKGKKINLSSKITNNKVNAYTDLGGISLIYTPLDLPIKIINGSLIIRNNSLRLNKINMLADGMPILADGEISDIFSKQFFNLYFNSKPKQEFIDKYINKNQIYPIKIKGDIVYSAKIKGVKDDFDLKADINLAPDASIYHLGATVGDVENAIVVNLDTRILKQYILKIKEFSYDKIIPSLGSRETRLNMLKAQGGIEVFSNDLVFHDLFIKTKNPTDARIFNIIFRKPNIKQGQFTSDLKFNGKLSNPKLQGNFHISETNIPFLDTTMKNITLVFKDKTIDLSSIGEIFGNEITIKALLKNKLSPPYYVENAYLNTNTIDLNYIINKLKLAQVDNYHGFESFEGLDLSSVVIQNLKLNANSILLRNIVAENIEATASLNEKQYLDINNFKFNIAKGSLNGKFNYNLKNDNTGIILNAKDINANDLTYALFDLKDQLYGDLTGDVNLSCIGTDFENCMKTLNGTASFNVAEGRMPKLGSLEYLLRAGNLVKGGITGLSLNSVLDIITPLKTGNFSNIFGNVSIKDGIANDIEISSQGDDLNLFISGNYNFATSIANMEVLGLLSKKISTLFGPIGNLSLNTLFNAIPGVDLSKDSKVLNNINKIPGIELSSKAYRKFIAEISGDINGEDYVTSFKWIGNNK